MKSKTKKKIISILTGCVAVVALVFLDRINVINIEDYLNIEEVQTSNKSSKVNENITDRTLYDVVRVVDGDTFVISYNGKDEKVRLIGVDTPESVHPNEEKNTEFGKKVSNYSKEMLTGEQVVLEFDVEQRDKYGRLLAYVYIDGQMYNKLLLEKGYAKLATYPPNVKYVDDFTKIQKEARENKVGLWEY